MRPLAADFSAIPRTPAWRQIDETTFREEIVARGRPAILKAIAADWPVLRAAQTSPQAFYDYIRSHDQGRPARAFLAPADIKGRFFYREDLSGLNFERANQPFHATLASIIEHLDDPDPPAIYAPAATASANFPRFREENRLAILDPAIEARLWVGNRVTAPTHYDMHDNVACVAAGRKRFLFFPPEQLPNLYIGPLDLSPGGQPTSMVRLDAIDFERYPRFKEALAAAEVAELEPGDAVFIPSMWWHNVDSLDPINLLVNYWWNDGPRPPASPFAALALGVMAISALPENRRAVWRGMFDHYVFQTAGNPVPYLPPDKRGMLGAMNPRIETYMRTQIIRSLTRALPRPWVEQIERWIAAAGPSQDSEQTYS